MSSLTLLSLFLPYFLNLLMLHWFLLTDHVASLKCFSALHTNSKGTPGCVCFIVQYIYMCFSVIDSYISFSAEVWNRLLAMQLHPLVGRRPVHQWTIVASPSPLVSQEGWMRKKICLGALKKIQTTTTTRKYLGDADWYGRTWSPLSLKLSGCRCWDKNGKSRISYRWIHSLLMFFLNTLHF